MEKEQSYDDSPRASEVAEMRRQHRTPDTEQAGGELREERLGSQMKRMS